MKKFFENIFSLKLYLQGLKRLRTVGIAAAICVVIPNALIPIAHIVNNDSPRGDNLYEKFAPFSLLMLLFAPMMVYVAFSYLNDRNKSDFFHSIPQKRSCVYVSFILAVISWIAAVILVTAIVNNIIWQNGFWILDSWAYPITFPVVYNTVLYTFAASMLVASYMTIAMMLTGSTISNVLLFFLIANVPRIMSYLYSNTVMNFSPGLVLSDSVLRFFGFEYFLPYRILANFLNTSRNMFDKGTLIYSIIVSVVIFAAACFAYVFRKSESAGKGAPNRILGRVYSCILTVPLFFILIRVCLQVIHGDGNYTSTAISLFAAIIAIYLIFELMMTKKLKNTFKSLKGIWIPAVVSLLIFFTVPVAEFTVESFDPDTENIKSITVKGSDRYYDQDYRDLYRAVYVIGDPEPIKTESDEMNALISYVLEKNYKQDNDFFHFLTGERRYDGWNKELYRFYDVEIELDNGSCVTRTIYFNLKEYHVLYSCLRNHANVGEASFIHIPSNDELISLSFNEKFYYPTDPDEPQSVELWKIFVNEYEALSPEKKLEYAFVEGSSPAITVHYYAKYEPIIYPITLSEEYIPLTVRYVRENFDE